MFILMLKYHAAAMKTKTTHWQFSMLLLYATLQKNKKQKVSGRRIRCENNRKQIHQIKVIEFSGYMQQVCGSYLGCYFMCNFMML